MARSVHLLSGGSVVTGCCDGLKGPAVESTGSRGPMTVPSLYRLILKYLEIPATLLATGTQVMTRAALPGVTGYRVYRLCPRRQLSQPPVGSRRAQRSAVWPRVRGTRS